MAKQYHNRRTVAVGSREHAMIKLLTGDSRPAKVHVSMCRQGDSAWIGEAACKCAWAFYGGGSQSGSVLGY